jgi:hypothetical protein
MRGPNERDRELRRPYLFRTISRSIFPAINSLMSFGRSLLGVAIIRQR